MKFYNLLKSLTINYNLFLQAVRVFKDKPLFPLNDENNEDESLWPKPDRLGYTIRGFKQAHVIFEKIIGVKNVINEVTSNQNKIWLLSTPEQPVVNIGLRKVGDRKRSLIFLYQ